MVGKRFTGSDRYHIDEGLSQAFFIASMLKKPLLVEGEPGTGKTKLALEYARSTGAKLYRFDCTSKSTRELLVSEYDGIQRLLDAQMTTLNAQMVREGAEVVMDLQGRDVANVDDYVRLGPLALAYQDPNAILLIDEIDKAPREFPNDLLACLDEREIIIPETGTVIKPEEGEEPVVVISSNREQDLPAPFKRRCAYHFIPFPDSDAMKQIVHLHYPSADAGLVESAVSVFYQLREVGLDRNPSTGEMLDWVNYLQRGYEGGKEREDLVMLPGHQALLKSNLDLGVLDKIRQYGVDGVLADVRR